MGDLRYLGDDEPVERDLVHDCGSIGVTVMTKECSSQWHDAC
jgi:hypothetical protein